MNIDAEVYKWLDKKWKIKTRESSVKETIEFLNSSPLYEDSYAIGISCFPADDNLVIGEICLDKCLYIDENNNFIENFKHREQYMRSIGFNVLRNKND